MNHHGKQINHEEAKKRIQEILVAGPLEITGQPDNTSGNLKQRKIIS